jgi:hypothetical protein
MSAGELKAQISHVLPLSKIAKRASITRGEHSKKNGDTRGKNRFETVNRKNLEITNS